MEESQVEKKAKPVRPSRNTSLRVLKDTKKRILGELVRVNRKDLGRKVRIDDYLMVALDLMAPEHIQKLQEATLSNADRFERDYRKYIAEFGSISKDEYLGKRLSGEIGSKKLFE